MAKYLKLKKKINSGLKLLIRNPGLFKEIITSRLFKKSPTKILGINQSIEAVLLEVKKKELKKILVVSDEDFFLKIGNRGWRWCSVRPNKDSEYLVDVDLSGLDGVIVGGADVKVAYVYIIKRLKKLNFVIPVFWVGNGFEFSGSTIPIIKEVENANIYLFNHYSEFFSIKDPLLLRVSIKDIKVEVEKYFILGPNETLRINLDNILEDRSGDALVSFSTTHPILTRGRHTRWRLWADIFYKNSFSSSHGAHDYGETHINAGFFTGNGLCNEKIIITLPNYKNNLLAGEDAVVIRKDQTFEKVIRSPTQTLDRVEIQVESNKNYGFRYHGKGETFMYSINSPMPNSENIMFNHNATQSMLEKNLAILKDDDLGWVTRLIEQDFLIYPHPIPVLGSEHSLEFGINFDGNNPPIKDFLVYFFDIQGKYLFHFPYSKDFSGTLFASELLGGVKDPNRVGLIVACPDLTSMQVDPLDIAMIGNLVIKNKSTLDQDLTEFQSCWRNIGSIVPQFPHWLHQSKSLVGTTNVTGRVLEGFGFKTGVALVNASGNLRYDTSAICSIRIFNPNGVELSQDIEINPFQAKSIWLNELFADLGEFLPLGYGSCIITSSDADLNAQIFSTSSSAGVALQHLWGY